MDRGQYALLSDDTTSIPTTRSHHSLTRREVFQNLANRILYSRFYMVLYIVMAILSVWSIFLSFHQGCASSPLFVILESIINCTMIAEVGLRLTALGRNYWRSASNILDVFLVIFCFITLILVLTGCGSGHSAEEVIDTVLLIFRNLVQSWRLYTMIRKNSLIVKPQVAAIDFSNVRPDSLDIEDFGVENNYVDDDDSYSAENNENRT